MYKILTFLLLSTISLYGNDYIWSQDTPPMSQDKSDAILKSFSNGGDVSKLNFDDDPHRIKEMYQFKENIFVVGLSIGGASYNEEVSNKTGSKSTTYSSYNAKFSFAKDFTLWHKKYSELSRIYFTYSLSKINSDLDFTTWTIGLRENMEYWTIYKSNTFKIYPTASIEFGRSNITRDSHSIDGLTSEFNLGLTYARGINFEYFCNLYASSIDWKHPIGGIADEMKGFGVAIGLNYKLMHGDF